MSIPFCPQCIHLFFQQDNTLESFPTLFSRTWQWLTRSHFKSHKLGWTQRSARLSGGCFSVCFHSRFSSFIPTWCEELRWLHSSVRVDYFIIHFNPDVILRSRIPLTISCSLPLKSLDISHHLCQISSTHTLFSLFFSANFLEYKD